MSYEIQYQGSKASLTSLSWQRVKPTRHLLLVHIGTSCFSGNNRQSLLEKIRLFSFLLGICIDLVMFVVPSSALQIQQNVFNIVWLMHSLTCWKRDLFYLWTSSKEVSGQHHCQQKSQGQTYFHGGWKKSQMAGNLNSVNKKKRA